MAVSELGAHRIRYREKNDIAEQIPSLTFKPAPNSLVLGRVRKRVDVSRNQDAVSSQTGRQTQPSLALALAPSLRRQRAPDADVDVLQHVQRTLGIIGGIGKARRVEQVEVK